MRQSINTPGRYWQTIRCDHRRGNPTTGYAWEQVEGDSAVVVPAGEPIFTPSSSALGSAGTVTMSFNTLAAGRTKLQLAYRRRFEPTVPPLKTFMIDVVVT